VFLAVHDTPTYARSNRLVPGNVITIEPGLYIAANLPYPKRFRGIGIRIEDNVVIREEHMAPLILSEGVPKSVEELEALLLH
jgi:Xaa-Pro aminopeptidase